MPFRISVQVTRVPVPAGSCIIHHEDVWHGSGPNITNNIPRRALGIHLINSEVRFVDSEPLEGDKGAPGYIYGRYKRHGCTGLDESFFPITFHQTPSKRTTWLGKYCTLS